MFKVPVFVGWLFFILIRNFDFQKGVHCIKQKKISIFKKDYANMNMLYVMFNKRAAAFYRFNHEPKASDFRPCKTLAASLLNEFKGISGKACLHGVYERR